MALVFVQFMLLGHILNPLQAHLILGHPVYLGSFVLFKCLKLQVEGVSRAHVIQIHHHTVVCLRWYLAWVSVYIVQVP